MTGERVTRRVLLAIALILGAEVWAGGFADQGFVKGAMRTEYDDGKGTAASTLKLTYGGPGKEGCLWDAENPDNLSGCPGRAPYPGSILKPWLGGSQTRDACGDLASPRAAETWTACIQYQQSKLFAIESQPGPDYWVVIANSDPSFDQCNLGPPDLSWPVVNPRLDATPAYFKVSAEPSLSKRRARLAIDANEFTHRCRNDPAQDWFYTIPFLSIGAQQGRGQRTPVFYFAKRQPGDTQSDKVSFDVSVLSYESFGCRAGSTAICKTGGVHAGVWMTSNWSGKNRAVFVEFLSEDALEYLGPPVARRWAWPIADSMFFPGLDIAYTNSQTMAQCGINFPRMRAAPPTDRLTRYEISPSAVFTCASRLGLFEALMPDYTVPLTGFHWFVESVGTSGKLELALENMIADEGATPVARVCKVAPI
jgi:hypothetical protein